MVLGTKITIISQETSGIEKNSLKDVTFSFFSYYKGRKSNKKKRILYLHLDKTRFTSKDAPEHYNEIDRHTLKSALKEIANQILYVTKKL